MTLARTKEKKSHEVYLYRSISLLEKVELLQRDLSVTRALRLSTDQTTAYLVGFLYYSMPRDLVSTRQISERRRKIVYGGVGKGQTYYATGNRARIPRDYRLTGQTRCTIAVFPSMEKLERRISLRAKLCNCVVTISPPGTSGLAGLQLPRGQIEENALELLRYHRSDIEN